VHALTKKVYGSTIVLSDPLSRHAELLNNNVEEPGTELASVLTQGPGWLSSLTGMEDDSDLDIVAERRISNVGSHSALSSVLRTDKFSHILFSLLHSVTNNMFSKSQASEVYRVISRGINRKFFMALIADVSPTTKSIAWMFLPAAAQCLDVSLVKALLATGVDPNYEDRETGESLFVTAIGTYESSGNVEIVQQFLDHGALVEVSYGGPRYTPLEAAADTGRLDLVRLLLEAGAGMNAAEPNRGSSALCLAALHGTLELVQILVDAGADVRGTMRDSISPLGDFRRTALSFAVRRADIAIAEFLISCGSYVNVLGDAVSIGSMEMVQLLLNHGANNVREAMACAVHPRGKQVLRLLVRLEFDTQGTLQDAFGKAALKAAVSCYDIELLTWLLDFGISVRVTPAVLREALRTAVQKGHLSITQLLVARGADINAGPDGFPRQSVLQHAVSFSHRHIVEFLLRSGADVNAPEDSFGRMAIAMAIDQHQIEIVRLLLVSGADMNKHGPSAVIEAVTVGSPELLRIVLDAWTLTGDIGMGRVVDRYGETPLLLAVWCANVELTQLLFDYNVCNAEDASSALPRAVKHGNLEVVKLLLASGANVNHEQDDDHWWSSDTEGRYQQMYQRFATAVDKAAESGNMDILNLLLQHPTTIENRSQALQVAAMHNKLDAMMALLDQGANVNAAPLATNIHKSRTALQAAAATGNLKLVQCLLDAGAAVESIVPSASERYTALQLAAIAGSTGVTIALIQEGADVRAPAIGDRGCTALEGAATHGRLDTVQLLINMGAERAGSRALNFARERGHDGVVALLMENGFEEAELVWSADGITNDEAEEDTRDEIEDDIMEDTEDVTMDESDEEAEDDTMEWTEEELET
jgi:ankyrin repeat protein